jgi:hypothetical protein
MGWFTNRFGTSDVSERPDFSSLAARAAGHALLGVLGVMVTVRGGLPLLGDVPPLVAWLAWSGLYAIFEFWQWWREPFPARARDKIPKRYDAAADWAAVSLLGGGFAVAVLIGSGGAVWIAGAACLVGVLALAAVQRRPPR